MRANVGQAITFMDTHGVPRPALVTHVFPNMNVGDGVNLVFVSGDSSRTDGCGRQTERATSVPHKQAAASPGYYWE